MMLQKYYKPISKFLLLFSLATTQLIQPLSAVTKLNSYYLAFPEIFQTHMQSLKNLDKKNPKVLILFSGTPGSGKTTISHSLEKSFNAIRISSDDVRDMLFKAGVSVSRVDEYIEYCLQELKSVSVNRTIIIDRSSDRRYSDYTRFAKDQGFATFLIRIIAPREIIEKRLRKRGKDADRFLGDLDSAFADYRRFSRKFSFDYTFDATKPLNQEINRLADVIKKRFFVKNNMQNCMKRYAAGTLDYIRIREEILACQMTPVQNLFIVPEKTLLSEIIPGLYLGSQKGANMVVNLERQKKQKNISHILTCRNDPPRPSMTTFAWLGIDIDDIPDARILHFFDQCYNFIEDAKAGALVHCKQGVSRSATVVIAYLMRKFNVPYEAAFNFVFSRRPCIDPNVGFRKQLKQYELMLEARGMDLGK